ncbi:hypothetical protein LAZ40_01125 [Cereibacter sphaeroides]|uniref:hypothetical protein n=1 Tax=Cereibacter sphaeroides TaxID=1063 RepID=UPI001F2CAC1B|nr:hypothetical protein [Cereibacter sphaeroides]MCE6957668.1 hypothetical protein [Cereibacter sphaeroides]MCE6971412.1 hypothetical protein [Cereibacter sphaeroides]
MTRPDPRDRPRDVPDLLFHGTSHWAWTEIQAMDAMLDDDRQPSGGICLKRRGRVPVRS